MRQRKAKDLENKLDAYGEILVREPSPKVWADAFAPGVEGDLYVEIGCGKGKFAVKKAADNPEDRFVAIEGQGTVMLRALAKAEEAGLPGNLRFTLAFVNGMEALFEESSLAGVYLNFSDPWPKARHAKRRLTHSRYLNGYKQFLKPGGEIRFKTDNDDLFDFSVEEIMNNGFTLLELTYDLHSTIFNAAEVTTEYEDKFRLWGKKIKYLKCRI